MKICTLRSKKKCIRRKKKIRRSSVMSVNIIVLKKIHRKHTEETDIKVKTEEMWLIGVCMYQKGYSESELEYKLQIAGQNDVGMPLMQ